MAERQRGKLIVLEGTDGSGKHDQTKLLQERLEEQGYKVLVGDFPRYETSEWGRLVGKYLAGEFGTLAAVSPYLAVLTYMLDEYTWSRDVARSWIEEGGMIVSNRYFTANVHQIAKLKGEERNQFREWVWRMGYDELGILRPDMVIFLDVDPRTAMRLGKGKDRRSYLGRRKLDIAEKNLGHQISSNEEYHRHVDMYSEWKRVNCMHNGDIESREIIHEKVWELVAVGLLGLQ